MALKIIYTRINGTLTQDISSAASVLPVDADTVALLLSNVNFISGDWTYLSLDNGVYSEEVKVTGVTGGLLIVTRAASGSVAQVFAAINTVVADKVGADAIRDLIAANPAPSDVTVSGSGIANVSQPTAGSYVVNVTAPNIQGTNGLAVTGLWPNISLNLELADGGCCGGCGAGGTTGGGVNQVIVNSAILSASVSGQILTLGLPSPSFNGVNGITVSGSWETGFSISGGGAGGTGTVTEVSAGTGLTLTGSPNTNPTLSLTATGVAAGTYGGFTFNAQGQLVTVASGFAPVGSFALVNGGTVVRTGSDYAVTLALADVGQLGIVALADSAAPINSADDSSAVTPKMLAAALGASGGAVLGAGSSTGESDAAYNNVLSSTAITLSLTAGQKAIVIGEVEAVNTAPTTPSNFGVGVFNSSGVKLYASRKVVQNKQVVVFMITGAMASTNISLVTTALDAADSITSSFLSAVVF